MFDYAGSFHLHSRYSFDGTTDPEEIVAAARRQKLDFIVLTDHFRLDARADGWEGWHDGVLVVVGEEISPRYNHYLALGIGTPVAAPQEQAAPQAYIDAVAAQGGIGLIAHPDHTGAPKFGVKAYPWRDWTATGYGGISVWDLMTDWQEKLSSLPRALAAYAFPSWVLSGPKRETLERWDRLNRERRVTGFGEVDNHDTRKRMGGMEFRIFPFDHALATIRTHVLLEEVLSTDAKTAIRQVLGALTEGRVYIAQEKWRRAGGFLFRVYDEQHTAYCGGEFTLNESALCEARIPHPGRLRLVRNGTVVAEQAKPHLQIELTEPGIYRIEADQKIFGRYKPWIYSNHIRVQQG